MRLGEMRLGEMRLGEMRLGEMRLGEMRLGEMLQHQMKLPITYWGESSRERKFHLLFPGAKVCRNESSIIPESRP